MSRSILAALLVLLGGACSGSSGVDQPKVVRTHPTGDTVQVLALPSRPYGVAVAGNTALVTQLDGQSVTRFSLKPFAIVATIAVGTTPTGVSVNSTGSAALVANQFDPSFSFVDLGSNKEVAVFPTTATTFRTIFSPDGSAAYGTVTDGTLAVFDVAGGKLRATVPIVSAGNGVAFGKGDTLLYVSSMTGGDLSVVNTRTLSEVARLTLGGTLQDLAVSGDSTHLYVAHEDSPVIDVLSLPTPSAAMVGTITTPAPVFGLAVTPDGSQLWATSTTGYVYVIDLATGTLTRTIPTSATPRRIAFDKTGAIAVVSDESGYVYEIR